MKRRVKVNNLEAFDVARQYLTNNFGATNSISNIHKALASNGLNIKRETLSRYIQIFEDAKILRKCTRFDMKSKRSLHGEQKYYLSDLSFYFANNTDNRIN